MLPWQVRKRCQRLWKSPLINAEGHNPDSLYLSASLLLSLARSPYTRRLRKLIQMWSKVNLNCFFAFGSEGKTLIVFSTRRRRVRVTATPHIDRLSSNNSLIISVIKWNFKHIWGITSHIEVQWNKHTYARLHRHLHITPSHCNTNGMI